MITIVHAIGCILVIPYCPCVDRSLALDWCAVCLQLIQVCKTSIMEFSRFGLTPLLYNHLVSCGLLSVSCGPFSICSVKIQHWIFFGTIKKQMAASRREVGVQVNMLGVQTLVLVFLFGLYWICMMTECQLIFVTVDYVF